MFAEPAARARAMAFLDAMYEGLADDEIRQLRDLVVRWLRVVAKTDPAGHGPGATETATDPVATDPAGRGPAATEPMTDPVATDPAAGGPAAIDPAAGGPAAIDPAAGGPAAIEAAAPGPDGSGPAGTRLSHPDLSLDPMEGADL
jgi:hypothetical protein